MIAFSHKSPISSNSLWSCSNFSRYRSLILLFLPVFLTSQSQTALLSLLWYTLPRRISAVSYVKQPLCSFSAALALRPADQPNRPVIYSSVFLFFGMENSVMVSPYSITSPSRKNAVLSEIRAACCILCVTMTIV